MSVDVVVAGAGHNSLITAAYLTRAGLRCQVLDARPVPGGGVASEELLLPGYRLDSCSTAHTLIQTSPLLVNDELGLIAEHRLHYLAPDPVCHVVFPDGEALTMWSDLDRTCDEIARFCPADAQAYRRLLDGFDAVKDVFGAYRFTPVGYGPSLDELLTGRPGENAWRRRVAMSALDVVMHEFSDRHVQAFMLWVAFLTGQPVDSPGSGPLAYSIVFGRQRRGWTIPRGGSGELARALVEVIEQGGGEVLCNRRVSRLLLRGERCVGVETDDHARYMAQRAVLSTIHVKDLVQMAPPDAWGEDFLYCIDTYDAGIAAFAAHHITTQPPRYANGITAVAAGLAGWPQDIVRQGRDVKEGRLVRDGAWLLFLCPTVADPTRAPAGGHTVKILGMQPYDPGGGPQRWEQLRDEIGALSLGHLRRAAPNLTDETILASMVVSPVDLERSNPHMWRGTFHGGDRSLAFSGAQRPAPGFAQHRMPIPGLYQTGGTTHPGGSVTGGPGRNAAIVMLSDFGIDPRSVMARAHAVAGA